MNQKSKQKQIDMNQKIALRVWFLAFKFSIVYNVILKI